MDNDIKRFIEKNIDLIEHEMYSDLYEQAYEWLSDYQCRELTYVLQHVLDNIDFNDVARSVAAKHVEIELNNMIAEKRNLLLLSSFIRLYMNHTCGIGYYDFRDYLIANPPYPPLIKQHVDNDGNLYFERIKKV